MANLDPVTNFGATLVSIGYDAAATSIALNTGDGAKLPQPSTDGAFNAVWYNKTDYPNPTDDPNREIVRVTARSTDTLTITRAQEGTSASTKNTVGKTYALILTPTAKMMSDINTELLARFVSAGVSGGQTATGGTGVGENLTLRSTSNATKGKILFGTSAYNEVNNRLGIGTSTPTVALDVEGNMAAIGSSSDVSRLYLQGGQYPAIYATYSGVFTTGLTFDPANGRAVFDYDSGKGSGASFTVRKMPGDDAHKVFEIDNSGEIKAYYKIFKNTSGVANCPTASGTQTITHGLGRTPAVIRINGIGQFNSNGSAVPTPFSMGVYSSSGNSCVYMPYNAAITNTQNGLSSTSFAVYLAWSNGNFISGVIQNVTSTSFDIVWTETGSVSAMPFMWEAQ